MKRFLREGSLVADIACGTGNVSIPLALSGFEVIGVDVSAEMLSEARAKCDEAGADVLLLRQDVRELDLYGTVDAAVCACDGLNYMLSEKDLSLAFERISLFMNPGGVFIFDLNTEYKFKEIIAERTFSDCEAGASYVWKNSYDAASRVNEYAVTFFVKNARGESETFVETHYQRSYDLETVESLLRRAGLETLRVNDAYTDDKPFDKSERVSFVAKKI